MIHAYDEMYVYGAMERMGEMLDYVTYDLCMDPDSFFKMFLDSRVSRKFEIGNPTIVAGASGPEIAWIVLEETDYRNEFPEPSWSEDRSDAYWAGFVMAYFQWYENKPFCEIWKSISIRKILRMYPVFHEADIERSRDAMERMLRKRRHCCIAQLRAVRGWSQAELAEMAGMSVSQLQRLEYGERKTCNMTLKTAVSLATALGIDVEELL